MTVFRARQAMGRTVRGPALVANDGFSARYDLDRVTGLFSRPAHKLAGQSYVGKILVLDTAKGGVAVAIAHDLKLPIRYVGVGESIDDLIPFSPDDYVTALFEDKW